LRSAQSLHGIADAMLAEKSLDLPYRPCVGIMLINQAHRVWVGRRRPKWAAGPAAHFWQMPQGGIWPGEDERAAALRELEEETGVTSVEVLAEAPGWLSYDLPDDLMGIALKGRYRGQRQKWFAMRFTGLEQEIDVAPRGRHKAEFEAWRWVAAGQLAGLIVPFKRQVYAEVVREFAAWLR
jgi:putative (di)nucleoside polyphosphate hydrolase